MSRPFVAVEGEDAGAAIAAIRRISARTRGVDVIKGHGGDARLADTIGWTPAMNEAVMARTAYTRAAALSLRNYGVARILAATPPDSPQLRVVEQYVCVLPVFPLAPCCSRQ